ncbi:E-selectin-like [Cylas formicarius]|nr:E-selectin-like [Cylas formicarius]
MTLATIRNQDDYIRLNDTLNVLGVSPLESYWLGGIMLQNGVWVWISTGERIGYFNWASTRPVYSSAQTEYCLKLGAYLQATRKYESRQYDNDNCACKLLFICESL